MTVGDRIRNRRTELSMTQEELAHKLGYATKSSINKIESGIQDLPQKKIAKFASALDTTPSALMGWDEPNLPGFTEMTVTNAVKQAFACTDTAELSLEEKIEDKMIQAYEKADIITKKHVLLILELFEEAETLTQ